MNIRSVNNIHKFVIKISKSNCNSIAIKAKAVNHDVKSQYTRK